MRVNDSLWLVIIVLMTSCIGKKQYIEELKHHQLWEDRAQALAVELKQAKAANAGMREKIAEVNEQLLRLKKDSLTASRNETMAEQKLVKVTQELEVFSQESDSIIASQTNEIYELKKTVESYKLNLHRPGTSNVIADLSTHLKKRFNQYKEKDISHVLTDGKVKMKFSDSLLFKNASLNLSDKGVRSIGALSLVLKKYPELSIEVIGHTDNIPIRRKNIRDNWDLSALRASTIIRILHRDFDIEAKRLSIRGKGEFETIASNDSPLDRSLNRRTEIILSSSDTVVKGIQP